MGHCLVAQQGKSPVGVQPICLGSLIKKKLSLPQLGYRTEKAILNHACPFVSLNQKAKSGESYHTCGQKPTKINFCF